MKREQVGRRWHAPSYDYDAYDEVLGSGEVDAVYIAMPNHLHCDYAVRAAERGVHVLCEKPLAVDEHECHEMIETAERHRVKLMTAYRLHFDTANLEAIEIVRSGRLGTPRLFSSCFTQDVLHGNVRLLPVDCGGGPVYDMGIYCINAARYLFRDEPVEVIASAVSRDDVRFRDVPETVSATMRFSDERLATFVCSFGAADSSRYEVIGDHGRLVMEPAYDYAVGLRYRLETDGAEKSHEQRFRKHDQFAAELEYFSCCVLDDTRVEPDGLEGLADVHIVRAIHQSALQGRAIKVLPMHQRVRPHIGQAIERPGVDRPPPEVHARGPGAR
jgi:glucose-fructose oxidoreductase